MGAPVVARIRLSTTQSRVLILLVISVFINYIDRGNLSVAAPILSKELNFSSEQMGVLFSSFFWTYAALQVVAGWMVDRFNVSWVYALGFVFWSAATALTGLAGGFYTLLGLRLMLGIGESVAYPSYSKMLCTGFPEYHRGVANAMIDAGSKMGPALGTLLGGLLMATFGWRPFFVVLGVVSAIWLIPWAIWAPRRETGPAAVHLKNDPPMMEILRKRDAWGTFFGLFCGNYFWYFMITWLPSYLVMERHYSTRAMAVMGSLPFLLIGGSSLFNGWLSDRLVGDGHSPTRIRKTFACSGLLLATLVLPAAMVPNQVLGMTLLLAASACFGLYGSNCWAITQTLAGPAAAGKWTGLQNGFGNLAGVAAPWITGLVVQRTGSFLFAFLLAALMAAGGAASYFFIVGKLAPIQWSTLAPLNEQSAGSGS